MDDVVPIGTKVRSLKIEQDGTAYADLRASWQRRDKDPMVR